MTSRGKRLTEAKVSEILYLLINNLDYPRNRRIRDVLEPHFEISISPPPKDNASYMVRLFTALISGLRKSRPQIVFLSELNLQYFPAAWALAHLTRSLLIVDWFVGMYETNILDWSEFAENSTRARLYKLFDYAAVRYADLVITDTEVRADFLREMVAGSTPVFALPVGSPSWIQTHPLPPETDTKQVLFYGDFLPLHGVDTILQAAADVHWPKDAHLTLVGDSAHRRRYQLLAHELGLVERCTFVDHLPVDELAERIASSHLVLGVFGASKKAQSVIPNKVWQGLSAGRPVVTRKSEAYSEIRNLALGALVEIDPTPETLASAVEQTLQNFTEPLRPIRAQLDQYVQEKFDIFVQYVSDCA